MAPLQKRKIVRGGNRGSILDSKLMGRFSEQINEGDGVAKDDVDYGYVVNMNNRDKLLKIGPWEVNVCRNS